MKQSFGARLREQRKLKGWTIERFAEQVGLSPNYMGDLERGQKLPRFETFLRIVEVLDVSADTLIRDTVSPASYVATDELSRKLEALTPQQKRQRWIFWTLTSPISRISQKNKSRFVQRAKAQKGFCSFIFPFFQV